MSVKLQRTTPKVSADLTSASKCSKENKPSINPNPKSFLSEELISSTLFSIRKEAYFIQLCGRITVFQLFIQCSWLSLDMPVVIRCSGIILISLYSCNSGRLCLEKRDCGWPNGMVQSATEEHSSYTKGSASTPSVNKR